MWNGRYDIFKMNKKCEENMQSNQVDLRNFKFVFSQQALLFYNSWVQYLKSIDIILNVTFAHIIICYNIKISALIKLTTMESMYYIKNDI